MINKIKPPSEYELKANEALAGMKIEFRAAFLFHGPFWPDDKESRNVWELILIRPAVDRKDQKTVSFRFGQSIADSFYNPFEKNSKNPFSADYRRKDMIPTQRNKPTAYDLLACITKNDPGTFSDFCGDMGMDTDSRKAEKTYFAVQEEWEKVRSFFSKEEIEIIQDIN